jgi:hypothetical protein
MDKRVHDMGRWVGLHAVPYIRKVYVWRTPKEAYNPECLVPILKHGRGSVMVLAAILYSVGPTTALHGQITAREYGDRLGTQVNPMIQTIFLNSHSWNCSAVAWRAWRKTPTPATWGHAIRDIHSVITWIPRFEYHALTRLEILTSSSAGDTAQEN